MAVTKKRRVNAYLELATDTELRETARTLDRSVTWCVRKAVEEWLERRAEAQTRAPWPQREAP